MALGALLGGYAFRKYRTTGTVAGDSELIVYTAHDSAAERARILAEAMTLVRDLINTAPADMVPADLAAVAEQTASASGLGVQVLDENELAKEEYGGILAVGMGSAHPPRLVRLEYTHPEATSTVVFAGKGITFDSGGLSLKPPKAMETMKADMSGAAAVLGALQAIAALGPAVNVVGYMPLAENMPGGGAQRPSDVITIYGGKTVEVLNTDAEGRLVLADALARSGADAPALLIDVATLTGAATVALGNRTAGVMASDDAWPRRSPTRPGGPARRCGRCRCPRICARDSTRASRTSPTWPRTAAAACWSPGCSCASSCRTASAGRIWTSRGRPSMTAAPTGTPPRAALGRPSGPWCRSRWMWRTAGWPDSADGPPMAPQQI